MKLVLAIFLAVAAAHSATGTPWGGELRMCLRSEPKTFHPALADNDATETIRYLTGGVLLRVNRIDQKLEPELATSWKLENGGRRIVFRLREGLQFSDGTPFTAEDVAYTMQVLLDPKLHSATGDTLRPESGTVETRVRGKYEVAVEFPQALAGVLRLFDQVAILSRGSPEKERATMGPFHIAEYKPGAYVLLRRNPNYWKTENGRRLPYLDAIRLDIQPNRELEVMRFRRGQIHLISSLDPDQFEQLAGESRGSVKDAGAGLDAELMWFNLSPGAPIESYRKAWFGSRNFRLAISHAIRRDDLCRVVYRGHAQAGVGPVSPANLFWFNRQLQTPAFDLNMARKLLAADGFHQDGQTLRDRSGRPVEFSLITGAGNRARERMAGMVQQDLAALGIKVNIATFDFPSLIERITKTFQYEACLLGTVNVDLDPNGQMNVWLSSSANHQWNPNQKQAATPWEAEIDRFMRLQAATTDDRRRKGYFDKVQQIAWEQAPFIYLVHRNALVAVSPAVHNVEASVLRPQVAWNVERLWIDSGK